MLQEEEEQECKKKNRNVDSVVVIDVIATILFKFYFSSLCGALNVCPEKID